MFKPVTSQPKFPLIEEDLLRSWKTHHIFQKSIEKHGSSPKYVLFDEPISASQVPTINHLDELAFKDVFVRYKSMRGYHTIRRIGWHAHGLPVELIAEKHLGFTNKAQVEGYSIDRFNELCRKLAFDHAQVWERLVERSGSWVDIREPYDSSSSEYIESVWWALKSLWDEGLLYQKEKFVHYCPHCGTPISDHIAGLGLAQAATRGAFVRFPLVEDPGTSLLVWAASPWTLPGNVAIAANPDVEYVIVERDLSDSEVDTNQRMEKLILAKVLVEVVFQGEPVRVYETFKGAKLKGLHYKPLFTFLLPDKPSYFVILDDLVLENGTGLRHVAPFSGEEDMRSASEFNLPVLPVISTGGIFASEIRPWRGQFVQQAEPLIIQDLQARGLVYRIEMYVHNEPYCFYCGNPLLNLSCRALYLRLAQYRDQLFASNQGIKWHPESSSKGPAGWLAGSTDWLIGIDRYWGTPLPIWECGVCHHQRVIGSVEELGQLAGRDLGRLDLHRPTVDEIQFPCPECNHSMKRLPEVVDAWFDAGCAPFAQMHYPFEGQDTFQPQFPIDLTVMLGGKSDLGFASLSAVSAMLFEKLIIKDILCLESLQEVKLRALSKPHAEAFNPLSVLNEYGADAMRWYFYINHRVVEENEQKDLSLDEPGENIQNFVSTLWNVYEYLVTHAIQDQWTPLPSLQSLSLSGDRATKDNSLDCWLRSRLHSLSSSVTDALENYNLNGAAQLIQDFVVDDLSGWYLRHAMGDSGSGTYHTEKSAFYATLYDTLVTLSKLLAPFTPFITEELYMNLVLTKDPDAPPSVHLNDWPIPDQTHIDNACLGDMALIKTLAILGQAARQQAAVKPHQPLSEITFSVLNREEAHILTQFSWLLTDELNVKCVNVKIAGEKASAGEAPGAGGSEKAGLVITSKGPYSAILKTELTEALVQEGLVREFVRRVQDFRAKTDLDTGELIRLSVSATPGLMRAIETHREFIMKETMANEIQQISLPVNQKSGESMRGLFTIATFDGERVTFGLEKM
jgi:isoleucyl-tRNA synthetase